MFSLELCGQKTRGVDPTLVWIKWSRLQFNNVCGFQIEWPPLICPAFVGKRDRIILIIRIINVTHTHTRTQLYTPYHWRTRRERLLVPRPALAGGDRVCLESEVWCQSVQQQRAWLSSQPEPPGRPLSQI